MYDMNMILTFMVPAHNSSRSWKERILKKLEIKERRKKRKSYQI